MEQLKGHSGMIKVFAGFLAATLLVLAVGCSGSDDDALVECVNVLADVARDHYHSASDTGYGISVGRTRMPTQWAEDNDVYGSRHSEVEAFIDEKCAPYLGVSATPKAGPVELRD